MKYVEHGDSVSPGGSSAQFRRSVRDSRDSRAPHLLRRQVCSGAGRSHTKACKMHAPIIPAEISQNTVSDSFSVTPDVLFCFLFLFFFQLFWHFRHLFYQVSVLVSLCHLLCNGHQFKSCRNLLSQF